MCLLFFILKLFQSIKYLNLKIPKVFYLKIGLYNLNPSNENE